MARHRTVHQKLDHLIRLNEAVLSHLNVNLNMETKMSKQFDNLKDKVEGMTTVQEGLHTVIGQAVNKLDEIGREIREARDDPAKLDELAAKIDAAKESLSGDVPALADAIVRNTEFDSSANK
jgi:chromosome segregation ATPase